MSNIAGSGGSRRGRGLLEFTLARPRNHSPCGETSVIGVASSQGFGISRNHPFPYGNRSTSPVVAELFLGLNGIKLTAWITASSAALA